MALEVRRDPLTIPGYSLTGDLLSFLRCGLQYRYHSGSALPPSRPVQLWFGEFLHGVLESAYRVWVASAPPFPWPSNPTPYRATPPPGRAPHDLGELGDVIEGTLRAQGKVPRSQATRNSAYARVEAAVNELGPHLFPLIASAEEPVLGTRPMPPGAVSRATLYELHGTIDVVTDVQLTATATGNIIADAIRTACPTLQGRYEVIVDYKGSRRPSTAHDYWQHHEWQVQTYAWLRMRQPQALPVVAGVLLYVNELAPHSGDIASLRAEMNSGSTDVVPPHGTQDYYRLNAWRRGLAPPVLSQAFRQERAIRVIPVDPASQQRATSAFDQVVLDIEGSVATEARVGNILGQWAPTGNEETCAACDFRHICPSPAPRTPNYQPGAPSAP